MRQQSTWMTHKLNKKERENYFNNWREKPAVGCFLQAAQLTTNRQAFGLRQLHSKASTVFTKVHETYCPSWDDMFQIRPFGEHSYSIQLSIQNVIAIKSSFPRNPRKVNLPEGGKKSRQLLTWMLSLFWVTLWLKVRYSRARILMNMQPWHRVVILLYMNCYVNSQF